MMKTYFATSVVALFFALTSVAAHADIVILDMDPTTAPIPGFPPGPATGFESSVTVTPGSTVTIIAYFVPSTPVTFDAFGIDLNFGLPGETAVAVPVAGTTFAGLPAGLGAGPGSIDLFGGGPVFPGTALLPDGIPPLPPYLGSIGAAGYFDPVFGSNFGGAGLFPPAGSLFDIFGQDFTVFGSAGDSVTIFPSGIFVPGSPTPGLPAPGRPLGFGVDALYDSVSGLTMPTVFMGGTIFIIPEPSTALLGVLLTFAMVCRRHRA